MTSPLDNPIPVKVAHLVWQNVHQDNERSKELVGYGAETPGGLFYAIEFENSKFHVVNEEFDLGTYEKLDEAKAAAQADYSSRILSAVVI